MVRNGDWKIREEIVKSLFAVYLKPRLSMSILFGRGNHNDRFIESRNGNGRTRVKPGSAKVDIVAQGQIAW